MDTVQTIRGKFAAIFSEKIFVPDKSGQKTIEILGAQFLADEETIFGLVNEDYVRREIDWYLSKSLDINDMKFPIPKIWKDCASENGQINSNYGFLVFDSKNGNQFDNCIMELIHNPWSRRAVMIYTRPSMWTDYNRNGMSDFICTNTVQYFIRQNPNEELVNPETLRLFARVDMRSNDAWAGFRNDYAWQKFIFDFLYKALKVTYPNLLRGAIIWNCGSLHLYERNFDLVQHYIDTNDYQPTFEELILTRKKLVEEGVIRERA
jgi:thymidylate synthase